MDISFWDCNAAVERQGNRTYECAIEGNKREGRTSSFGPYGGMGPMQHSPLPPSMGGGMHMMGMMATPPRPMQAMNGNRPPMHPGEKIE